MVTAKNLESNSLKSTFYQRDPNLDPMILTLKFYIDVVKMSNHTKNEVSLSGHSKVIARPDKQTNTDSVKTLPSGIYAGGNI